MPKGTKIFERLPDHHLDLLKFLEDQELNVFTIEQMNSLTGLFSPDLNEILENLAMKKMIDRIERGKYCRYGFRNEKIIGSFITGGGCIAYWSALNHHLMTEQIPNVVFVQSPRFKQSKSVFNVRYKFVKILNTKFFGIIQSGYGQDLFPITDKEKTLIDCFEYPEYSGGYSELIRALATTNLIPETLVDYGMRTNNLAVLKRIAFLSEIFDLHGYQKFRKMVITRLNVRYSLFDPLGPDEGEFVAAWRLRLNITRNQLIEIAQNRS
ncbi:MAG: hypothetical protein M0Q38_14875 [Bacteroidales bacterium]|jgi:predicted transcriptional regulator of viral defense system|nr:hypothetical protein [Bacteroidales bacterium]